LIKNAITGCKAEQLDQLIDLVADLDRVAREHEIRESIIEELKQPSRCGCGRRKAHGW
jgi:cell division septum initiation protein DivIVA